MKHLKNLCAILFAALLFTACAKKAANHSDTDDSNPFNGVVENKPAAQKEIHVNVDANIGGYLQALPSLYDSASKRYPLLVFLHGVGELGNGTSDLWKVGVNATPQLLRDSRFPPDFVVNNQHFSFIVITPQFKNWPSANDVTDMINYAISKYRIDTTRLYVAGLSMGGGVTWENGAALAKRLAAIVPICGASGPNDTRAQQMAQANLPVWAFHNEDDGTVSVNNSKDYVNKINSYHPNPAARLTTWPTGGHDAWSKAANPDYRENGMNMYEWMLQYSRGGKK